MSRRYLFAISILLLAFSFFSCAVKPKVSPIAKTITIFYTGDLELNKITRLASYVKQERAKNPNLFMINGKIFSDEPMTVLNRGEAEISILESAGIDGIVLTPDFLRFGSERAKELIDKVKFFFLAANLYETERPRFFAQGYLIKEMAKTRVSLIGLFFDSTSFYLKLPGIKPRDPVYTVKLFVPMQRMRESDLVGLIVNNVDSLNFGDLDFIIGAKSSKSISAPLCNKDESLRRLDLFLSSNNRIIDYKSSVVMITDSIIEDSLVKATLEKYQRKTDSTLDEELVEADKKLAKKDWTSIVEQAILTSTKADGILMLGPILKEPIGKGVVTSRTIYPALDYTKNLPIISLSGKEIIDLTREKLIFSWSAKLNKKKVSSSVNYRMVVMPNLLLAQPAWQEKDLTLSDSTVISMVTNYFKKGRQ